MEKSAPFPGISWLIEGRLGGCLRPDSDAALVALQSAGTRLLISLTAEWHPDTASLKGLGISSLHVPIKDFAAPTVAQADAVCAAIHTALSQNQPTVLHCAAGKGRTGTLLTAYLIFQGLPAEAAIKKARSLNPDWIETPGQIAFLKRFAELKSR